MSEHDLAGLKRLEPAKEEKPVPRWFDRQSQKNDEIPELIVTDEGGESELENALKGKLEPQKEDKKKRGRPAKGRVASEEAPVVPSGPGTPKAESVELRPAVRSREPDVGSPPAVPVVREKVKPNFLITINTAFGVMEVEAYDVIVEAERKLFGICYLKRVRGNRFLPKPDVGNVDIQVQTIDGTETKDYTVVPLGVQFTLPKDGLLVVLFELVQ